MAAGALYSYILYLSDKKSDFHEWLKWLLASLRFIAVTIIAFLLLSPLLRTISRYIEKPIIIIAQDNSKSIITNKDSSFYKNDYLKLLDNFRSKLNRNFDFVNYTFGEKVSGIGYKVSGNEKPFSEKETDISALTDYLSNLYSNRNVGALILATDGVYNKGSNPLYATDKINYPVYTLALGDTNIQKDIIIKKLNYNKTAYLGNTFPLEIVVNAYKCKGSRTKLVVSRKSQVVSKEEGENVYTKDIDINSDMFSQTIPVQIEAKKAGIQYFRINLSPIQGEISPSNNTKEIFIEVMSSKQKILILAASPHPDISAIKEAIETNINYEADAFILKDFDKNINDYSVIILDQLPSVAEPASLLLSNITKAEIPVLYIIGTSSNINAFNNQITGLTISDSQLSFNEALPSPNNQFPLFTMSRELLNMISSFPPLMSPFGTYTMKASANVLLYQRIGNVTTKNPLILFNQTGNIRDGVIAGEGLWKWRINEYMQKNNHDLFNELINKTIQYLSIRGEKTHLKITSTNSFSENEQVNFDAELYNDSYELINEPDINLTIFDRDGKKYPYLFSKTNNAYHLNAGIFPPGLYKYNATTKIGNNLYQKEGEFSVSEINIETMNTIADHKLLYNISKKHNGEMFYPNQMDKLAEAINKKEDIKSISYTQKRFNDIINLTWVFFLILGLLTAEWFLRKWSGTY
jgi:hypothetical protein